MPLSAGGLGQIFPFGQHIDQGGFTHVRPADKGIFRQRLVRAFGHVGVADYKVGGFYFHGFLLLGCIDFKVQKYLRRVQDSK
jgi:hypothetical protein